MKTKFIYSVVIAFIAVFSFASAQQSKDFNAERISPLVAIVDLQFALHALNTIDIKGNEVDAFLDVKNLFKGALEYAEKNKISVSSGFKIETTYPLGKNIIYFLEKITLSGANAENYKRLTGAIILEINRVESGEPIKKAE